MERSSVLSGWNTLYVPFGEFYYISPTHLRCMFYILSRIWFFPLRKKPLKVWGGGREGASEHSCALVGQPSEAEHVGKPPTCAHLTIVCPEDHDALCTGIDSTWKMLAIFSQPDPCPL